MTDLEKVVMFREINWTPAVVYWKERLDEQVAKTAEVQLALDQANEIIRSLGGEPVKTAKSSSIYRRG